MNVSIFDQFSIFDAGKQKNIEKIIDSLPEIKGNEVTINFVNCLVDYPATSKLIDKILIELSKENGVKTLKIISDLTINNESLILSLMVWGSNFFDFTGITRTATPEEFKKAINTKIRAHNISMHIVLTKDDGSTFKEFKYE